jgi:hypothetical protein
MSGSAIAVLRVLDKEDYQECKDRAAGVDCELPSLRVRKVRARQAPYQHALSQQRRTPKMIRTAQMCTERIA